MREAIVKIPLKGKGLPKQRRDISQLGISKLVNIKPEEEGLKVVYIPDELNASTLSTSTINSHGIVYTFFSNELSLSGKTNKIYAIQQSSTGYYKLIKRTFVLDRTTMTTSFGMFLTVATFDNENNIPIVLEAEGLALISNGYTTVVVYKTDAYTDTINPTGVPKFKTGCYFNGQFIVGNIQQGSTIGNGQATIMWSDIGNHDFTIGMENIVNTCTDQVNLTYTDTQITETDNTIGYAILPANCSIIGMHTLGDGILVCTSGGLFKMTPFENTWGIQRISKHACVASCLGDSQVIFIDKTENSIFKINASYQIEELGYKYLLSSMINPLYQLTYFPLRKEFQIYQYKFAVEDYSDTTASPIEEYNFILNEYGLYQTTYKILCDDIIPPYIQSAGTVTINSDNVNFSDRIRIVRQIGTIQDASIGIGSTTLGLMDSFNVRHMKLITKVNENKVIGNLLGITLQVARNTSFDGSPEQEIVLTSPDKEIPLRSFIVYPNISGKELYFNLILDKDSSSVNEDIVFEELEMAIIIEGSIHRRSVNVSTANTN